MRTSIFISQTPMRVVFVSLAALCIFAQEPADGIRGVIVDATGARIPNTTVKVEGANSEMWFSHALQIFVLRKQRDPRFGEKTIRTANVLRTEPDESLFKVPSDYTINGPRQ